MERHGKLRKHQQRALLVANEFVRGQRHQKFVVAGVTPGGGKTLMASLFANTLADGKVIEQALVVVPNAPLREQMREGFHDESRGLERYLSGSMRQAPLPGMGKPFGQVVTYQALSSVVTAKRLASWCAKRTRIVRFGLVVLVTRAVDQTGTRHHLVGANAVGAHVARAVQVVAAVGIVATLALRRG